MQTDDRVVTENGGPSRGRGALIGIAAAVLVLVAGSIFLLTNDDPPVAEPAPNATLLPRDFQPLEPGAYYADTDGDVETSTRGTFVIEGSGWQGIEVGLLRDTPAGVDTGRYVSLFIVEVAEVWESPCDGRASVPSGTTAKALGDQFAAMSEFTTREGLTSVTAFGQDGYHLVLEVPACVEGAIANVWTDSVWGERNHQEVGQVVEYWFLDVDGTTVMVEATRPPESGEEIALELEADLDGVLDTLVITP